MSVTSGQVQGQFDVQLTPEHQGAAPEGGSPTSRFGLLKTFHGPLQGIVHGTMISAGELKPGEVAAYVAIDQFQGQLDGRRGGFMLTHRGTIARTGASELLISVVPDSGTGGLTGIAGSLQIDRRDGKHFYDFSFTLPAT